MATPDQSYHGTFNQALDVASFHTLKLTLTAQHGDWSAEQCHREALAQFNSLMFPQQVRTYLAEQNNQPEISVQQAYKVVDGKLVHSQYGPFENMILNASSREERDSLLLFQQTAIDAPVGSRIISFDVHTTNNQQVVRYADISRKDVNGDIVLEQRIDLTGTGKPLTLSESSRVMNLFFGGDNNRQVTDGQVQNVGILMIKPADVTPTNLLIDQLRAKTFEAQHPVQIIADRNISQRQNFSYGLGGNSAVTTEHSNSQLLVGQRSQTERALHPSTQNQNNDILFAGITVIAATSAIAIENVSLLPLAALAYAAVDERKEGKVVAQVQPSEVQIEKTPQEIDFNAGVPEQKTITEEVGLEEVVQKETVVFEAVKTAVVVDAVSALDEVVLQIEDKIVINQEVQKPIIHEKSAEIPIINMHDKKTQTGKSTESTNTTNTTQHYDTAPYHSEHEEEVKVGNVEKVDMVGNVGRVGKIEEAERASRSLAKRDQTSLDEALLRRVGKEEKVLKVEQVEEVLNVPAGEGKKREAKNKRVEKAHEQSLLFLPPAVARLFVVWNKKKQEQSTPELKLDLIKVSNKIDKKKPNKDDLIISDQEIYPRRVESNQPVLNAVSKTPPFKPSLAFLSLLFLLKIKLQLLKLKSQKNLVRLFAADTLLVFLINPKSFMVREKVQLYRGFDPVTMKNATGEKS